MSVQCICDRCGKAAAASLYEDLDYGDQGVNEPEGWYDLNYCGDPCVPNSTRRHGPWLESWYQPIGDIPAYSVGFPAKYLTEKVFPVVALNDTKAGQGVNFKFTKRPES